MDGHAAEVDADSTRCCLLVAQLAISRQSVRNGGGPHERLPAWLPGRVVETPASYLFRAPDSLFWGTDSCGPWRALMTRPARTGRRQLGALKEELPEHDLAVVHSVASLRFLTAQQIEALHFTDHATPLTGARICRRVLERLVRHRVLVRLDRRIGGIRAGSASFVYSLGPVGSRLLQGGDGRRRMREPSQTFLEHTLAVAQLVVDLRAAHDAQAIELLHIETEPTCWRPVRSGLAGSESLKPDLFVALVRGEYEYRWFVEQRPRHRRVRRGAAEMPHL